MKLPGTFKTDRPAGFALIEIVVALGLITFILSMGLFLNINSVSQRNFWSEEELVLSLLRTARSRAVNNVNGKPHGLFLGDRNLILFEGDFEKEQSFDRNPQINIETSWLDNKVVFKNITGELEDAGEIKINDGNRIFIVRVNKAGGIE